MITVFFVTYKTLAGRRITIGVSNEQLQNKEYSFALKNGYEAFKFRRVI